jgi:hypothetical protein
MQFVTKTRSVIGLNIFHGNKKVINVYNTKFHGQTLDNTFSWKIHIDTVVLKFSLLRDQNS